MAVANTLYYYNMDKIMAAKTIIVMFYVCHSHSFLPCLMSEGKAGAYQSEVPYGTQLYGWPLALPINSKLGLKLMANTLDYYNKATILAVKSFILFYVCHFQSFPPSLMSAGKAGAHQSGAPYRRPL